MCGILNQNMGTARSVLAMSSGDCDGILFFGFFVFVSATSVGILFFPFRRSLRWRNGVLLAASLVFYAWGEPIFVFVMLMVVFINWRLVIHMKDTDDQRAKKWILSLTIGLDIALIFVFKYLGNL